jgi:hypothetical protein
MELVFHDGQQQNAKWIKPDKRSARKSKAERMGFGLKNQIAKQREQRPRLSPDIARKLSVIHERLVGATQDAGLK